MPKQLLRNEQDTRALCCTAYDTNVPSQQSAVISAKAQTQACNEAVQEKGRGHGLGPLFIGAWAGLIQWLVMEGPQLGESLANLEELNKWSIENRCRMVKRCRMGKTFEPWRCRATLAVGVPSLRSVVGKSLDTLQGKESTDRVLGLHWDESSKIG